MDPPEAPPAMVPAAASEEVAAKVATKRYETLAMIREKAIKGKGAWYWAHLEPFLSFTETGLPKAVKLRCSLCGAAFSASNPSRTSTDHLKKGSCPNFISSPPSSSSTKPMPISSAPPASRKRPSKAVALASSSTPPPLPPPMQPQQQPVVLSGGKGDLPALAMLEDSIKRLKSPKASPGPPLPRPQADAAFASLAEWVIESCGSVSFSSLKHPKFADFLRLVGLPAVSPGRFLLPRLDSLYREALADSDAKIHDAAFFQLCCSGWKKQNASPHEYKLVHLTANLPNGTTVFRRALLTTEAAADSDHSQLVLCDALHRSTAGAPNRCAGIIADRFRSKSLLDLENEHSWMVNLSCQIEGVCALIKDFVRELPVFKTIIANCFKIAAFFNRQPQIGIFHKYQLKESSSKRLFRTPTNIEDATANFGPMLTMLEDVLDSITPIQLAVLDEDYKLLCAEERAAVELGELIEDVRFWNELEAVCSIINLINDIARELELERPLIGQCLPLWNELKSKVHDWCNKYSIETDPLDRLIERRLKKNYHPAWSAAFILDPLYLTKDASGKYLPPFHLLTHEQEKDVDRLITRMVSPEEAHIVLMELMKWRTDGLDPLYAQAVQVKQPDPMTGKLRIANPQSSRLVWETCLSELRTLGKVAVRLIFLHGTVSSGVSFRPPVLQWLGGWSESRAAIERTEKMVFVAAHAKLERRDFSKDADLFDEGGDDDDDTGEAPSV